MATHSHCHAGASAKRRGKRALLQGAVCERPLQQCHTGISHVACMCLALASQRPVNAPLATPHGAPYCGSRTLSPACAIAWAPMSSLACIWSSCASGDCSCCACPAWRAAVASHTGIIAPCLHHPSIDASNGWHQHIAAPMCLAWRGARPRPCTQWTCQGPCTLPKMKPRSSSGDLVMNSSS